MLYRLCCFLILSAVLLLPGCTLFRDTRPDPSGSPYGGAKPAAGQLYSEAEAINAAVSAISLKMAVSKQGPFRLIPKNNKVTRLVFRTIDSLTRMGLSRIQAPYPLYLEDSLDTKNKWTLVLTDASGKIFYRKTFILREK